MITWLYNLIADWSDPQPAPKPVLRRRFVPVTYEEWKKLEEQAMDGDEMTCPECEGDCYVECDECGHEHECEECDGTGKVLFEELSWRGANSLLSRYAYINAMREEAEKFAKWTGQDFDALWNDYTKREKQAVG